MKPLSDGGADACADLHRRPFSSHRMARSDTECPCQKLAKRSPEWDIALIETIGSLGLWNATAASVREELCQQESRHQAHQGGNQDVAQIRGRYAKQQVVGAP